MRVPAVWSLVPDAWRTSLPGGTLWPRGQGGSVRREPERGANRGIHRKGSAV